MSASAAPLPSETTAPSGPTRASERALAPDLARGAMLLLIALANCTFYLWASPRGGISLHPVSNQLLDQITQFLIITTVDMRTYPMFAFLFGYGVWQMYRRQAEAGVPESAARRLLRRRNWWLIAFGFAHALLLWVGDVLGAYGLAGLVMVALFLRRADRTLITWASIMLGFLVTGALLAVVGAVFVAGLQAPEGEAFSTAAFMAAPFATESYPMSMLMRIAFWPFLVLGQGLLGLVVPMMILIAFWAARRGVLERPGDHLPLLRRTVIIGLTVGWLGGLPEALAQLGVLPIPDHVGWVFQAVHPVTGLFAGVAYVALFGLLAHRLSGTPAVMGLPVRALQAVGQRSMSAYLAQSVICAPVLCAWGLGVGAHLGSFTMALFAIGVWLITVLACLLLARHRRRGPAEVLIRRLAYGKQ